MSAAAELAEAVRAAWIENTRRVKARAPRSGPRDYLIASNLSDCARAMALDLLHPEDQAPFDDETLERFYRGDEVEAAKVARLHQIGLFCRPAFKVVGGQREVEIWSREYYLSGEQMKRRLLIRGRVEGTLEFQDGTRLEYEVKSGKTVERVETIDDLLRGPWTRKQLRQFVAYLYAEVGAARGTGSGVFIADKPGIPAFIPVDLGADDRVLSLAEETLKNGEAAVAARFGDGEMPPFSADPGVCRRCCHLGKSCHPPIDLGPGAEIDESFDAGEVVREYIATQEAAREHERCKRFLFGDNEKPGRYRGRPTVLVGGRFLVQGKWEQYTRYPIPKEVKAQYKEVDPEGSWKPSVVAIESGAKD